MFYPRFIKIIIHHFPNKDKSISMRNRMFMHIARDDSLLGTMRFISRHADTQVYGAILPKAMTNQALLNSVAYKTYYAIALGVEPPKSRKSKKKLDSAISSEESPSMKKYAKAKKVAATKPKPTKKKASEVNKRSKKDVHISHESGSGVPDVPTYDSKSEKESWGNSGEEDDDDEKDSKIYKREEGEDDDDGCLHEYRTKKQEKEEEKRLLMKETMDVNKILKVLRNLYNDVNVNLGNRDADMTNVDQATTSFPSLPDFSSVFKFNDRVTNLEKNLSEIKQVDQYAQALSSIPAIVDRYIDNKLGEAIQKALRALIWTILPQVVSNFANSVIEKNVIESLEVVVLERSSSQPNSTYKVAASLSEFELTKILIDKMEKSNLCIEEESRHVKDKDQDPSVGSDRGTNRWKSSKEAESSRDSRSKEMKSSSTSKDASHSQHKSSGKSAHAEEPSHTVDDSGVQQDQEFYTGNNDEQLADKEVTKADWFKKPE
ncbi:hypothetical protein Tco_0833301 [Tanacetum coccineum]